MIKRCKTCNELFWQSGHYKIVCSDECRLKWKRRQQQIRYETNELHRLIRLSPEFTKFRDEKEKELLEKDNFYQLLLEA
jgi:hypothetical protein